MNNTVRLIVMICVIFLIRGSLGVMSEKSTVIVDVPESMG